MRLSARLWGGAVVAAVLLFLVVASGASAAPGSPSYTVIVVREGQTLWSISRAYGVSVETIVEINGLDSPDAIRPGQRLKIPLRGAPRVQKTQKTPRPSDGTSYTYIVAREGQTLWSLSQTYGVSVELIAEINGLRNPDAIRNGQRLRIPVRGASPARWTPPPRSSAKPPPAIVSRHQFVWPARGELTSRYGWRRRARRHHAGIDIGAPWGSPIVAAMAGTVRYSGWYHAYGRTVILDHENGITTLYGHASKLLVRTGQRVAAGQPIAKIGCTGRCTGPHLHFEIRLNGRALNPLSVSLVDSLPVPTPKAAAPAKPAAQSKAPAAQSKAPQTASIPETVVRSTMIVEGPNGQTVKTIIDTLRDGVVVKRIEVTTTVEGSQVVRVQKTYELVDGALKMTAETREVVDAVKSSE